MTLATLIERLDLCVHCTPADPAREVTGGYASDLLSDVMGRAEEGMIWLTIQIHRNVIAVASLKEVAAVLLTGGTEPSDELLEAAHSEGIAVLSTPLSTFEAAGRIYALIA